jgi:hypothetical protein
VGLEREFRTSRDLLFDVLKLQKGYNNGKLTSGIIITYDESVKGRTPTLERNKPYLQELDKLLKEFGDTIKLTIPLLVIGLKQKTFLTQVPQRRVKYPAKDRGPSYQKYLEKLRRERKEGKT